MRRLLTAILLCPAFCAGLVAQNIPRAYCCTDPGTVLHYERHGAENGRLWWTYTSATGEVKTLDDGSLELTNTFSFKQVNEKPPVTGSFSTTALVKPDGDVIVDVAGLAATVAKKRFKAFNFKSTGGSSLIPADIRPGDKLEDIHAVVKWAAIKYIINYTEREVLRRETVTVPSGTFDCIVLREHKLETAPFLNRERIVITWYAPGIGSVRHDTCFLDGSTETTEVLVAIDM